MKVQLVVDSEKVWDKTKLLSEKFVCLLIDVAKWVSIKRKKISLMVLLLLIISAITFVGYAEKKTHIPSQMLMAEISYAKAGNPVPFDPQPTVDAKQSLDGFYYNSELVAQLVDKIVPFFVYDHLTSSQLVTYPMLVGFIPYDPDLSLSVAGYEYYDSSIKARIIMLNNRYLYDKAWNDERDFLGTLTHELIHAQGYGFDNQADGPEIFEAKTQAASTEILASMCDMKDQLACQAFWLDISDYSRAYVRARFDALHAQWAYKLWSRIFFWKTGDEARFDKRMREWGYDMQQYEYVLKAYSINPYTKYLVPAVFGAGLDTEEPDINYSHGYFQIVPSASNKLVFDDTAYQLGMLTWLLPPGYNF